MQRIFPILQLPRPINVLLAFALFIALAAGCSGPRYAAGPEYSAQTHDYLRADDTAAFTACVAMCSENTSLALVTRTGCLDGCEQARRSYPLSGRAYSSRQSCQDALMQTDLARAAHVGEMRRWCDAKWSHVHNRKGCYLAAEMFYANLTAPSVCGSDLVEAAIYDASLSKTKEEAAKQPAAPIETPVVAPTQEPFALPIPPEQPAVQELPQTAPAPALDAVPSTTAPDPAQAAPPTAGPQVVRSTQPAGPLEPPPYAPEPGTAYQAAQPDTSAPLPPIHDTPKYQKQPPARSPRGQLPGRTKPSTPPDKGTPKGTTEPFSPNQKAPASGGMTPPVAAPKEKLPALPEVPKQPALPAVTTPAPAPQTDLPLTRAADPTPPEQTISGTPGSAPNNSDVPAPDPTAAAPVPAPEAGQSPVPQVPENLPLAPQPGNANPTATSDPTAPSLNTAMPRSGPPIPGLNANRPTPPASEPAAEPDSAPSSMLMPPVPSMLQKPYDTPTLITPHMEVPPDPGDVGK